MNKNLYIYLLEYGAKKLEDGDYVSARQLIMHDLPMAGFTVNTVRKVHQLDIYCRAIYGFNNFNRIVLTGEEVSINNGAYSPQYDELYILPGSYQDYLEYIELKEARRSAKNASYYAIIAIVISIIALGLNIYFSEKQINNSTTIDEEQIHTIINEVQ